MSNGMKVHSPHAPLGQVVLRQYNITLAQLEIALARFEVTENSIIGTPIGINDQGFFASYERNWDPGASDAFKKPLLYIPWMQILELLEEKPPISA